jgi:hypothetical protein
MATAAQPRAGVPAHGTRMTREEFFALPDDARVELVDAVPAAPRSAARPRPRRVVRRRGAAVYTPDAAPRWLGEAETLDGGTVVPGFRMPVAAMFAGLRRGA